MRKLVVCSLASIAVLLVAGWARADESLVEAVKKACHAELTTFCKGVKPG
jgi:hypothetical protein